MVLVGSPRIDPGTLRAPPGVEVRGYAPRLHEHFAACDVAVRRPFLSFPLEGHLEQNLVVANRLARHRAGQRPDYSHTAPEQLAQAIADQLGHEPSWPAIPSDRPQRAAANLNRLLARGAAGENHEAKRRRRVA